MCAQVPMPFLFQSRHGCTSSLHLRDDCVGRRNCQINEKLVKSSHSLWKKSLLFAKWYLCEIGLLAATCGHSDHRDPSNFANALSQLQVKQIAGLRLAASKAIETPLNGATPQFHFYCGAKFEVPKIPAFARQ